uniref:Uncharacterized protein n=1 Tax=Solanum tuberosum TaxID=4113 RepID=M1DNG2_SOLTU
MNREDPLPTRGRRTPFFKSPQKPLSKHERKILAKVCFKVQNNNNNCSTLRLQFLVFIVFIDCAAEDCSATLVEITDELGDLPFGQLIAFNVLPLVSSHFGSLDSTVLLCGTDRRFTDCSFPRLLIYFLQGFAYWNEGWFLSFRRLAKLNSAIRRIPVLVLFSPICSVLRLSVHASTKTSNT